MRVEWGFVLSLLAAADAMSFPRMESAEVAPRDGGACPAVWKQVKAELNTKFMDGKKCNALARAAIRAIFHDCGSWDTTQGLTGGCDGSLIVGSDAKGRELDRSENRGLSGIAGVLQDIATRYNVSVADTIVFAGNAAIVLCPGGPKVKTFIGRTDNKKAAPEGGLPDVFGQAADLTNLFARKGLSAADLAALLGAHSTSTQAFVDTSPANVNLPQDSTPGDWDVQYYNETYTFATTGKKPNGVFVFPSDSKLATYGDVGKNFQGFIGGQSKWQSAFANAMEKMALFGNDKNKMADCTNMLG
ncbi:versatile peroxidase VPL1 [Xylariales sp. PMI_506]|nr:versatile peroxidase VPL1 [Xylariales sp. PMI_506]